MINMVTLKIVMKLYFALNVTIKEYYNQLKTGVKLKDDKKIILLLKQYKA